MSSLREFDRVEDRIRQHRQVDKRPVLIVEGPDDLLVLKQHIPADLIFPADGKTNVLRAIAALRGWSTPGVRAVVDADFDDIELDEWIVAYDARDLEGMLISLGVLDLVLEHRGSSQKLSACGGAMAVRSLLVSVAMPVANLRSANARNSWGLRFDDVDVHSKTDRRTLNFDASRYCMAILRASDTSLRVTDLLAAIEQEMPDKRGPRGRDVVSLAGVALRHRVGTLPAASCEEGTLSSQLRSSAALIIERSDWMATLRVHLCVAEAELAA